eukprot:TRINITY_DN2799_c0_g1_i5.p1 TRINITY_DN2799_c0_g1~~TRINITY_DN2799_c0_g1_i5.p1  ORF type:complete len:551 (+),score=129.04 TRINITY_DN2799_c0_g1_i5:70-1722(+)
MEEKVAKARAAYQQLFEGFHLQEIKRLALHGQLQGSPVRGICWRIFLGIISDESTANWEIQILTERQHYEDLRDSYIGSTKIRDRINPDQDHQSPSKEATGGEKFSDAELVREIRQDIERTYPDDPFFENEATRDKLWNILFIYSKENPSVLYKQGMHELLAVLIYLLNEEKLPYSGDVVSRILDEDYVEHDAYNMFEALMNTCKEWFLFSAAPPATYNSEKRRFMSVLDATAFTTKKALGVDQTMSPIVKKCYFIQNNLLKSRDPEFHKFLCDLEIEPQLYALKWIRLLFAREFSLAELLVVWDALFADDISDLVNYICLSFLMRVRPKVIGQDYMTTLREIFAPPEGEDPHSFVETALTLRETRSHSHFSISSSLSLAMKGMDSLRIYSQSKLESLTNRENADGNPEESSPSDSRKLSGSNRRRLDTGSVSLKIPFRNWQAIGGNSAKGDLPRSSESQKEIARLQSLQNQMASDLQRSIDVFHQELISKGGVNMDVYRLQYALAELKKIKDILSQEIEFDPTIYESQQNPEELQSSSEQQTHSQAKDE